jgi:serine/threonine protein kinase
MRMRWLCTSVYPIGASAVRGSRDTTPLGGVHTHSSRGRYIGSEYTDGLHSSSGLVQVAVTGTEGHLTLKVCDFGLAKHKRATYTSGACAVRPLLPWTAPEVLRNPDALTEKVDVYSFGIVLWELWTSLVPHHDAESQVRLHPPPLKAPGSFSRRNPSSL